MIEDVLVRLVFGAIALGLGYWRLVTPYRWPFVGTSKSPVESRFWRINRLAAAWFLIVCGTMVVLSAVGVAIWPNAFR